MVKPRTHSRTKPPRTPHIRPLGTARELAEILDVSRWTIYNWARRGYIPSLRASDRILRFDLQAVLDVLEGGRA